MSTVMPLVIPAAPDTHPDFSSPDADVVLRSNDGVLFRVSSDVLCRASGWLKTMFTLPQGPNMDRTEPIPMDEPSSTLYQLLSIVDGRALPPLDQTEELERLLAAAEKYEMPMVISILRLAFSSRMADVEPLRLYSIACRMGWVEKTRDASSRTLTTNLLTPKAQAELATMASHDRDLLLNLHHRRREAFFEGLDDTTAFYANTRGSPCNIRTPNELCTTPLDHGHWWALKYALLGRWAQQPLDGQLDETIYYMPEVWDVSSAKCRQCDRKMYNMMHTVMTINAIIHRLPRRVD